jgi:hypothetical protein
MNDEDQKGIVDIVQLLSDKGFEVETSYDIVRGVRICSAIKKGRVTAIEMTEAIYEHSPRKVWEELALYAMNRGDLKDFFTEEEAPSNWGDKIALGWDWLNKTHKGPNSTMNDEG